MRLVDNWHCRFCGDPARGLPVCAGCRDDLPWNDTACPRCALPGASHSPCAECLSKPPPIDLSVAPFVYAPPIDQLIQRFKFQRVLGDARWLSDALAERRRDLPVPLPDLILPVPLYRWRLWWRGFNQAAVIARHVGQRLRVPVHTRGIGHSGARVHQVGLDARARRRAVRGAFDVRLDLRDRHVALVDDVMTTGATLHELAQAVRAAGASRVEAWVLARTPKSGRG
jgi:ComF family protein|tara:strand:- start:7529 stop:8209 length:681 start_codon:yes stop_codon:yes gene_type:complete